MQDDYSWNGGAQGASTFRLPQNEGQGRWVVVALVIAVLLHVAAIFGLSRIDVLMPEATKEKELFTKIVRVKPVDFEDSRPEVTAPESPEIEAPIEEIAPPLDELEALENLPDIDMDIAPEIDTMEVPDIKAAMAGAIDSEMLEPMKAARFEPDLPEMGKTEDFFPRANDSQVTVDPGARLAEEYDPDAFTETMRKGVEGESEDGLLKDFTSLDQMANMDGNTLVNSKALIGSDLLFEFNSAELRQSARVSLMKVALLIHKHPKLVCWVDGHTDLIGSESANMELSERRAMAVKRWLINAMDLDKKRIAVRGFGKQHPIVKSGTREEQAPNRRVEIKMRKSHPTAEVAYRAQAKAKPKAQAVVSPKVKTVEVPKKKEKPPVKAVLVKPTIPMAKAKAILVEEDEPAPKAPKAIIEPDDQPVQKPVRKAVVVPEDDNPKTPARPPRRAIQVPE